jgi:hypothetical protein
MSKNHRFQFLYDNLGLDWIRVYRETNFLLRLYRDAAWSVLGGAEDARPEPPHERFDARAVTLFESRRMLSLIDLSAEKVRRYHENGALYHNILHMTYLSDWKRSESEILEKLCMSRTNYYDLRRDAVSLLGVALHSYMTPRAARTEGGQNLNERCTDSRFPVV